MNATSEVDQQTPAKLSLAHPFRWLRAGWSDLWRQAPASLFYGACVASVGALMLAYFSHPYLIAAAITGFMLFGPVLTGGVCALSQHMDQGRETSLGESLNTLREHRAGLSGFALALAVVTGLWFGSSALLLNAMLGSAAPSLENAVLGDVFNRLHEMQLMAYLGVGAVLAALVLALSVITVPSLIDRDIDARSAMASSFQAFTKEFIVVLLWGVIATVLVAVGFATQLLALVIIFPLLGHSTWHAYKDLAGH